MMFMYTCVECLPACIPSHPIPLNHHPPSSPTPHHTINKYHKGARGGEAAGEARGRRHEPSHRRHAHGACPPDISWINISVKYVANERILFPLGWTLLIIVIAQTHKQRTNQPINPSRATTARTAAPPSLPPCWRRGRRRVSGSGWVVYLCVGGWDGCMEQQSPGCSMLGSTPTPPPQINHSIPNPRSDDGGRWQAAGEAADGEGPDDGERRGGGLLPGACVCVTVADREMERSRDL